MELASRESSLDPTAQNKSTTAYGLFQFLDSTWNGTGTTKSSNPSAQAAAAIKYIKSRYGTPEKALAFWDKNNWY
jgi:SLT domain-containing protein